MNPELWKRLKMRYFEAANLPAGEREAFVQHACGDDAELRKNLQELLRADDFLQKAYAASPPFEVSSFVAQTSHSPFPFEDHVRR